MMSLRISLCMKVQPFGTAYFPNSIQHSCDSQMHGKLTAVVCPQSCSQKSVLHYGAGLVSYLSIKPPSRLEPTYS